MWDWLKNLWNSAKNVISSIFEAFLNWIIYIIEVVYSAFIASVLLTYFAYGALLYVMFYVAWGDAFIEIWNPNESQPKSQISNLGKAPSGVIKPNRPEAEVFQFKNTR